MLCLYICCWLLFLDNNYSACRSIHIYFLCSRPFTCVRKSVVPPQQICAIQIELKYFTWSQLKLALVYFDIVQIINYILALGSWKDKQFTLLSHLNYATGETRQTLWWPHRPDQRVTDIVLFLICYMFSAQVRFCWQKEYTSLLLILLFVSATFSFFQWMLPLSVFFRSSRLIGWWRLWMRLLKVFTHC